MARPIKDTPVLTGEDARRFMKEIENPVRVSEEERRKSYEDYILLKSICIDCFD